MANRLMYNATLLRRRREELGLSQEQVARATGVSQRTISSLERGATDRPAAELMKSVADFLGLPFDDVMRLPTAESGEPKPSNAGEIVVALPRQIVDRILEAAGVRRIAESVRVPLLPNIAYAGASGIPSGEQWTEFVYGSPEWRGRKMYAVRVRGNCMEPDLMPDDIVVFEEDRQPKNGELVVSLHEREVLIKIWRDGVLESLHDEPISMTRETRLIGTVVQLRRNNLRY